MKQLEYTCEHCKGEFVSDRPEGEAEEELQDLFGATLEETDCGIICDECFRKLVKSEAND